MAETTRSKWFHSIWFVLLMLFFVLGPIGFGLLWQSPRFNRPAKILLTAAVIIFTCLVIQASWTALQAVIKHYQELQPVL